MSWLSLQGCMHVTSNFEGDVADQEVDLTIRPMDIEPVDSAVCLPYCRFCLQPSFFFDAPPIINTCLFTRYQQPIIPNHCMDFLDFLFLTQRFGLAKSTSYSISRPCTIESAPLFPPSFLELDPLQMHSNTDDR